MGRFEEFELPVRKIQDYPLVYEALIPQECIFFQDIRRYQLSTASLDVKIIDVNGTMTLEQDMVHVPMAKLSAAEKKAFVDYLRVRVMRGDNIGSSWTFFRSGGKKKHLTAYGANIVYKDSAKGQARATQLLKEMSLGAGRKALAVRAVITVLAVSLLVAGGFWAYKGFIKGREFRLGSVFGNPQSREMKFYQSVFPKMYAWTTSDQVSDKEIARYFLNPDYIANIIALMDSDAYRDEDHEDRASRLALFVYFNYNRLVPELIDKYRYRILDTELYRLSKIYSTAESNYSSNIFYFKVGNLDIKNAQVTKYLNDNRVSYRDYKKIRDKDAFSDILQEDAISYKLKGFLEDVYTFTPLRADTMDSTFPWYLLVRKSSGDAIDFAAFFEAGQSTLVPKSVGAHLIQGTPGKTGYIWYSIDPGQAQSLNLSATSHIYFTGKMGQSFKLEILSRKISELGLKEVGTPVQVSIHRELLMEDSKGKFGVQCFDPITSLVLSNLISKSSFETESNVTLKRDPIQINTSLIQLSKDDSYSTQSINITPGKMGIVELFRDQEQFKATLANGKSVTFEQASQNLFNPFSFMVYNDSITFSYRHEIGGMEFEIGGRRMKIAESADGGHQIISLE